MARCLALLIALACGEVAFSQQSPAPPEKPFTLLLITANGGQGNFATDPRDQALRNAIYQPQSQEMKRWAMWASPKELAATSPIVREHHADLTQQATGLPILALVDSTSGAVWHSMSSPNLPRNEYDLARKLDVYYAATMDAARQSKPNAMRTVSRIAWDQFRSAPTSGPEPFKPLPGGGIFGPDVKWPDSFDANANVNTTVDPATRQWGNWIIGAVVGCVLFTGVVGLAIAWLIGEAITNPPPKP